MRYCNRCVLPDSKPGVMFDADGICSVCRAVEKKKKIDWDARAASLRALCDTVRGTNGTGYDCVVPVSGGKDSVYQAYMMSRVYGLKTLGIILAPHLATREGILNLNAMVTNLGVDLLKVSVRPSTLQKIRRIALIEIGNPNYAEHRVVFAGVARAALFYGAPLVVWGEDIAVEFGGNVAESAQSDGSAEDLIGNDLFRDTSFEGLLKGRIPENELFFYGSPAKEELKRKQIRSIYLGYYHWWDGYKHLGVARQFGFQPRQKGPLSGNVLDYDNIDEKLCEIHIWFKFLKLGFWRPTDQCCYHIWNGRMSREEGAELVRSKQYEFPVEYLPEFLEYHQLTEMEFWEIEDRWRNRDLWHKVGSTWRLKNEII
jgi:N-acetyl sugar amidotransferase